MAVFAGVIAEKGESVAGIDAKALSKDTLGLFDDNAAI